MKLSEAISRTDDLKHNTFTQQDKICWVNQVDMKVKLQLIDTHEGGADAEFCGYDEHTDPDTELLIPAPFDEIYLLWMQAQIDYHNGEYARYNNSAERYNTAWSEYRNHYNRTHMPKGQNLQFF